jgi:hypothetical protein
MLPTVGSLKEDSFERIWSGAQMRQARAAIAAGNCSCTHECFLFPSFEAFLLERPMTLVRLAGFRGLMHWLAAKSSLGTVRWHLKRLLNRRQGP